MKKLIILLAIVLCAGFGFAYEESGEVEEKEPVNNTGIPQAVIDGCPTKGMMVNNMDCFDCHTKPSFKVREAPPFERFDLPYDTRFEIRNGETIGHYTLQSIRHEPVRKMFEYFDRRPNINTVIINVDSYGGGIFEMWGIVSVIEEYKDRFNIITECRTTALSAGLVAFMAADTRLVSPTAQLMWHEVSAWTMFDKKFPSKAEHEAEMMRAWQDLSNSFIADKSGGKITKEEIDNIISYRDWWLNGRDAVEKYGLATGYIE